MSLPFGVVTGLPGVKSAVGAAHRIIFKQTSELFLAQGKIISSISRDPGNTGNTDVLRAGLVMGKVTASGEYAPSIMGLTNAAAAVGATSLTLTTAAAAELARRVGASGTFRLVGPPSAAGVVAEEAVTYSAISSTTVTVTALANAFVSGSFVTPDDGSEDPVTVIPDGWGVPMAQAFGGTAEDQPFPQLPTWAVIIAANIIDYPADASLKGWLKDRLRDVGVFTFDDDY